MTNDKTASATGPKVTRLPNVRDAVPCPRQTALIRHSRLAGLLTFVVLAFAIPARADLEGEPQVRDAMETLPPFFAAKPDKSLAGRFHPDFLKNHPVTEIEQHFQSVYAQAGKATSVHLVKMLRPYAAEVEFIMQKGFRLPATLGVDKTAPYRIDYLLLHKMVKESEDLADIQPDLEGLTGTVAYSLARLGGAAPKVLWNQNGEKPLAVGSTFKLCVFATLIDDIAKGKRKWEDHVAVHKEWLSLPAGLVQDWPDGAPVTLYTLAALMISKSDNTAADHLMNLLGRERIEQMLHDLGIFHVEKNLPFMTTAEALKIKLVCTPEMQKQFADADTAERRRLLDTVIKSTSLKKPRRPGAPVLIDKVDWFLSTNDLCRVMDWLRKHEQLPYVKEILNIDEGLYVNKSHWRYIGYKGGQEPGVVNFTVLLQNAKNDWYAFAITWNDPQQDVDMGQLIKLTERLLRSAQKQ